MLLLDIVGFSSGVSAESVQQLSTREEGRRGDNYVCRVHILHDIYVFVLKLYQIILKMYETILN